MNPDDELRCGTRITWSRDQQNVDGQYGVCKSCGHEYFYSNLERIAGFPRRTHCDRAVAVPL